MSLKSEKFKGYNNGTQTANIYSSTGDINTSETWLSYLPIYINGQGYIQLVRIDHKDDPTISGIVTDGRVQKGEYTWCICETTITLCGTIYVDNTLTDGAWGFGGYTTYIATFGSTCSRNVYSDVPANPTQSAGNGSTTINWWTWEDGSKTFEKVSGIGTCSSAGLVAGVTSSVHHCRPKICRNHYWHHWITSHDPNLISIDEDLFPGSGNASQAGYDCGFPVSTRYLGAVGSVTSVVGWYYVGGVLQGTMAASISGSCNMGTRWAYTINPAWFTSATKNNKLEIVFHYS